MSLQFSSLRPCEPEDLELLYTIENDRELWDTSNADAPYSRYAIKQYIAAAEPIQVCGELRLIIDAINEEGKKIAVGLVDLTDYSALHARSEVGIALLKEFRGMGLGKAALQDLATIAKNRLRIHSLYAIISTDNETSLHLFESIGYQAISTLPQWHFIRGKYVDAKIMMKFF